LAPDHAEVPRGERTQRIISEVQARPATDAEIRVPPRLRRPDITVWRASIR